MNRGLLKELGASGLHATGVDRVIGAVTGRSRLPLVVCYHRVVDEPRRHPDSAPAMLIGVRTLERQLDWIGRRYRFVGLDELSQGLETDLRTARPVAAVTFDDGYADVYHRALPLLQRKGIPAAVFVPTDFIGTERLLAHDELYTLVRRARRQLGARGLVGLLDRLGVSRDELAPLRARRPVSFVERLLGGSPRRRVVELIRGLERVAEVPERLRDELRPMSWPMVEELHAAGMTIGSHTRSHRVLPNETARTIAAELRGSKRELERRLGAEVIHLAYPDGQFCPLTVEAAAAAGYRYAYATCFDGSPERPLLAIPRRTFWERSGAGTGGFSPAVAACQVHGVFDALRPCAKDHGPRPRPGTGLNGREAVS
jgi:peptidoglycan/xylan/chitin deacetylase (PgdA/CDA1 family)